MMNSYINSVPSSNTFLSPAGIAGFDFGNDTNIAMQFVLTEACSLRNLIVRLTGAPVASAARTLRLRRNQVDTVLTCTIANSATECSSSDTVAASAGDEISFEQTVTHTPSAAGMHFF